VRWKPVTRELRLTLVTGTSEVGYETVELSYRGALLGRARIQALRGAAMNREACILYTEIDMDQDGMFEHRLLFWPNEEVTLTFAALELTRAPRSDKRVRLHGAFVIESDDELDELE